MQETNPSLSHGLAGGGASTTKLISPRGRTALRVSAGPPQDWLKHTILLQITGIRSWSSTPKHGLCADRGHQEHVPTLYPDAAVRHTHTRTKTPTKKKRGQVTSLRQHPGQHDNWHEMSRFDEPSKEQGLQPSVLGVLGAQPLEDGLRLPHIGVALLQ